MLRSPTAVALTLALSVVGLFAAAPGALAAGEYEQNDSRETAYGALAGGTDYTATFETNNDVDWYIFYLKTYSQMDFSATAVSGCGEAEAHIELRDKDGKYLQLFHSGAFNEVDHLNTTLPAGRYYLEISNDGCVGDRYRFRIDPAASLTTSRVCGEAIVARDAVTPQLAALNAKLAKNSEALAKASSAFSAAKRTLQRLKRRPHASRYSKQLARRKIAKARASREKILAKKVGLDILGAQYTIALNQANANIALTC